jgi:hypothetical protein
MEGHDTWAETGSLFTLTAQPYIDRIWQYYVMPNLDMVSALKTVAPKVRPHHKHHKHSVAPPGRDPQTRRHAACHGA